MLSRAADRTATYWAFVAALCLFGLFGIFSIGAPFLLLGLTLAVVAPWRRRPAVLWPAVGSVVAFIVGFILVMPLGCSTSPSVESASPSGELVAQTTTCNNALGINYSGSGLYSPSLLPALLAGLVLTLLAAASIRLIVKRRGPS